MGSGGSKLGARVKRLPASLLPILRRRYEDIKRHRSMRFPLLKRATAATTTTTPYKKVLLKHEDGNATAEQSDHNLVSCCKEMERTSVQDHRAAHLAEANVKPDGSSIGKAAEDDLKCSKETDNTKEPLGDREERIRREENDEGENAEEKGLEEKTNNEEGSCPWPGSPSFRIYYVESLAKSKKDDGKIDASDAQIDESYETDTSKDTSEGSMNKKAKKGKKGMRKFTRALTKGKPAAAVMNLLNMRSCYYLSCSSHDRTHLLTGKVVA